MAKQYWSLEKNALTQKVEKNEPHCDDIEMSGLYTDMVVYYGANEDGSLFLKQRLYFPTLRNIPNNTHATFCFPLNEDERVCLLYDGSPLVEYAQEFRLDGMLLAVSETECGVTVSRRFYPASDKKAAIESVTLRASRDVVLSPSHPRCTVHSYGRGTKGVYVNRIDHTFPEKIVLSSNEEQTFYIYYSSLLANEKPLELDGNDELLKRRERISSLCDDALVLSTASPELDMMLRFAKLRAGESIFETLTGKYHSPGGHAYYAAIWCNDEIEYAGPHFAMTGDKTAIEASINAYRAYIPFMSETYSRLPSSIIAEGLDVWEGAGDRGDAAMYLYGCSLFCLYLGDRGVARSLFDAIKWCAEYCERQKTPEGVIRSDSDELEGRFPTDGYANLSTSSLCYGGLIFAARLADSLGEYDVATEYRKRARSLGDAIESYFGATLRGFETYRYSAGFDTLRAWICLPLCMGITKRASATLDAMLSPYLWTEEGMLSCERSAENTTDTIWDRSTLYGMKCAFLSGAGERMLEPLLAYCHKRLVCDRVPYAVEAHPEGDKRHLSGESALFVRVITEGLFGLMPESFDAFSFVPNYYEKLGDMKLSKIHVCGGTYDVIVAKDEWTVCKDGRFIASGKTDGKRVRISTKL